MEVSMRATVLLLGLVPLLLASGVGAQGEPAPPKLSPWFAPLFVQGQVWVLRAEQEATTPDPDGETARTVQGAHEIVCTVREVRTLGAALASQVSCVAPAGSETFELGGKYVGTQHGLWGTAYLAADPAELTQLLASPPLLAAPPRAYVRSEPPERFVLQSKTLPVPGGATQAQWCLAVSHEGQERSETAVCFAEGLGMAGGWFEGRRGRTELKVRFSLVRVQGPGAPAPGGAR
jgi:hypothetical protein